MLLLAAAPGAFLPAAGGTSPPKPEFKSLRAEEDYRYLRDPAAWTESLDAIKYLPLSEVGGSFLSLGGEVRLRYEYYRNAQWGQGPQDDDGYLLTRAMLHGDVQFNEAARVFVQLKSGLEDGRTGGPRPTDEDRLDLHQAFFDLRGGAERTFTLRVGRQELAFGSSRLVSVRESPNVRQSFDGLRGIHETRTWRGDVFVSRPVETNPGSFDDATDRGRALWGAYAVLPCPVLPGARVDVYYLGLRRDRAVFDQGVASEKRHSVGARVWGQAGSWDYNWEFVGQAGSFGGADLRAWTVATDTGFNVPALPLKPRFGLKANVSSGDRDPHAVGLQTFNALFPRGAYFSESALLGPANLIDLHPGITLQADSVTLTLDWDWFWRESDGDGLYGPAVNLVRSGRTSRARDIGNQGAVSLAWEPDRHWTVAAVYAHFNAGSFLRESGAGEDVDYASITLIYRF